MTTTRPGRLYAGTSGFAYAAWAPRFYPSGLRADQLLAAYAARLTACEINNTFYRWPTEDRIRAWVADTPETFRFSIKAQRASSMRAIGTPKGRSTDPAGQVARLVAPLGAFSGRLGTVLFRVPEEIQRADERLAAFLAAWPPAIPLTVELQHESWAADETFNALRDHGAALCATELPEDDLPPTLRLTGPFLYVRLRRHDYSAGELAAWATRLAPFLADGKDVFTFFRHDPVGRGAELAQALEAEVGRLAG
ncbi:MAG TPA: DUF72 domain-containing protein [Nonomuraea sp.]|nr:DUF72 domain-containing protein [Nonomuraea sp.]